MELHTFFQKCRTRRKRRIRFLTDAKIVVFFFSGVVGFVVFAVVLRVVRLPGAFFRFMALGRIRVLPMDGNAGFFALSDRNP